MTDIKVGSEWIRKDDNKIKCKVLCVGHDTVFIDYEHRDEVLYDISYFILTFKPAPVRRTVWLNVYSDFVRCYRDKETADEYKDDDILFQQEVELIDPRKGEGNE